MSRHQYAHVYGSNPVVFLPADVDVSEYLEISSVGDCYAKFMNIKTGEIIDCSEIYQRFVGDLK